MNKTTTHNSDILHQARTKVVDYIVFQRGDIRNTLNCLKNMFRIILKANNYTKTKP